jgi:hypothetical protein
VEQRQAYRQEGTSERALVAVLKEMSKAKNSYRRNQSGKRKKKGEVGHLIIGNKVTTLKVKNEEFPYMGLDLVRNDEGIYFGLTMEGGGLRSF